MSDNRVLLRFQRKIATAILMVFLGIGGLAGSVQLAHHHQHDQAVKTATHRAHFWRVVASQDDTRSSGPEERLAADLEQVLSQANWENVLRVFSGNSNAYGGVTDALGISPFNAEGKGCEECGPLTPYMRASLELVKHGKVEAVIAKDQPKPIGGYTFTPFGWSIPLTIALFWIFGGWLVLVLAWLLAKSNYDLSGRLRDLDWSMTNRTMITNLGSIIISPVCLAYMMLYRSNRKRLRGKIHQRFPYLTDALKDIDQQLEEAKASSPGDPEIKQLTDGRNDIVLELEKIVRSKDKVPVEAIKESLAELQDIVQAFNEKAQGVK